MRCSPRGGALRRVTRPMPASSNSMSTDPRRRFDWRRSTSPTEARPGESAAAAEPPLARLRVVVVVDVVVLFVARSERRVVAHRLAQRGEERVVVEHLGLGRLAGGA